MRVTWTARRSNQSILKEVNSEYSLEGLMLNLKLQYFGHLMPIADLLEKTLMLGKTEGRRRREWQDEMVGWHDQLNGHNFEHSPGDSEGQKSLVCCRPWGCKEMETTEWLKNNSIKDERELSLLPLTLLLFNTLTHVFFFLILSSQVLTLVIFYYLEYAK